jgi:hypothetical protein
MRDKLCDPPVSFTHGLDWYTIVKRNQRAIFFPMAKVEVLLVLTSLSRPRYRLHLRMNEKCLELIFLYDLTSGRLLCSCMNETSEDFWSCEEEIFGAHFPVWSYNRKASEAPKITSLFLLANVLFRSISSVRRGQYWACGHHASFWLFCSGLGCDDWRPELGVILWI